MTNNSHYIERERIKLDYTRLHSQLRLAHSAVGFLIVDIFVVSEVAPSISLANFAFSSSRTVNLMLIIPSEFGSDSFPSIQ